MPNAIGSLLHHEIQQGLGQIVGERQSAVLVVDDVADSGRTMKLVLEILREQGAEVRSAVLYEKSVSVVKPDYTWRHTDEWIVFPWSDEPPVTPSA